MLLDINRLLSDWGKPKGVIHIGSQFMLARKFYIERNLLNTIWIESNPFFFELGAGIIENQPTDEIIFNYHISDEPVNFSLKINDDDVSFTTIQPTKLKDLFDEHLINLDEYDFLHFGTQGPKISLSAFEDVLDKLKYLSLELVDDEKNKKFKTLNQILNQHRFKKVLFAKDKNLSHVFYIKKRNYLKK